MFAKYYFSSFKISNSPIKMLVSNSKSSYVNVNICFTISNFEKTLVLMCLGILFDIIESWKVNVGHRDIYYAKKY